MSKFFYDANYAKAIAIPQVFSEKSQAKNADCQNPSIIHILLISKSIILSGLLLHDCLKQV